MEHLLSNIQIARCTDHVELIAVSHQLPDLIKSHGQVPETQCQCISKVSSVYILQSRYA